MDPTKASALKGPLDGVEALLFDVFGTTVEYVSSVTKQLEERTAALLPPGEKIDFHAFTLEWRKGFMDLSRSIASGGSGLASMDMMHRQLLEELLSSPRWESLGAIWDQDARDEINLAWHRLDGWPDASEGVKALKRRTTTVALSNGNVKLLIDTAKYADIPWDAVLSAEFFGSYKPNSKVYLGAAHHLSLSPSKCAMVAAHIFDLRGAAGAGFKTVYVRRPTEDSADGVRESVKTKDQGGEVDVIVDSFEELLGLVKKCDFEAVDRR